MPHIAAYGTNWGTRAMDEQVVSQARAEVIEKFINLEWLINLIISQHYFGKVYRPFILEVLYDENCSFILRRRILEKIIPGLDKKQIQNLNRLNTIRNYFAHTGPQIVEGAKVGKGQATKVPDPRKLDKAIDFTKLYKEFQRMEPIVAEYLFKLYQELRGKYPKA